MIQDVDFQSNNFTTKLNFGGRSSTGFFMSKFTKTLEKLGFVKDTVLHYDDNHKLYIYSGNLTPLKLLKLRRDLKEHGYTTTNTIIAPMLYHKLKKAISYRNEKDLDYDKIVEKWQFSVLKNTPAHPLYVQSIVGAEIYSFGILVKIRVRK